MVALLILGALVGAVVARRRGDRELGRWGHAITHFWLFALLLGIFGQAVCLHQMMEAIKAMGGVSPALLSGGLRVSFIAPLYGLFLFTVAMVLRFVLGQLAFRGWSGEERRAAVEPGG